MKMIDLSYPMVPNMLGKDKGPHQNMELTTHRTIDKDGMQTMSIRFGNHVGTHLDGPAHVVKGARTIAELPLDTFYGTGVVLDVPKGADEVMTIDDLKKASPAISRGDIVIIHTGWGDRLDHPDYFQHHPYMANDCALWLVEQKIKMIGADLLSPDLPWSLKKEGFRFTTLRTFLENEIPVLLQMTNLGSLVGRRVFIMALPIAFQGSDSAPARAVAMVDE